MRKPLATVRSPHSQNGTMAKDAWWVRKVYWHRERAHDKIGKSVVCCCVWLWADTLRVNMLCGCKDNMHYKS